MPQPQAGIIPNPHPNELFLVLRARNAAADGAYQSRRDGREWQRTRNRPPQFPLRDGVRIWALLYRLYKKSRHSRKNAQPHVRHGWRRTPRPSDGLHASGHWRDVFRTITRSAQVAEREITTKPGYYFVRVILRGLGPSYQHKPASGGNMHVLVVTPSGFPLWVETRGRSRSSRGAGIQKRI